MAGQHAVLKGITVLSPNIKHVTDTLSANKNATSAAGAAVQEPVKAQGKAHAQEEFTFIMDDELINSCAHATRVQSKVRRKKTIFTAQVRHSPIFLSRKTRNFL